MGFWERRRYEMRETPAEKEALGGGGFGGKSAFAFENRFDPNEVALFRKKQNPVLN
jgi:hypothetical protein